MPKTIENLKTAFAGESQANRKYLAFAKKAMQDGKMGLAKLFKAAAAGETVHALSHLNVLGDVKSSKENLQTAIFGETYEIDEMYPQFITEATDENEGRAKNSFDNAEKVEEIHQRLFKEAMVKIENDEDIEEIEYHICQVCGNPLIGVVPDVCPICGTPKEKFIKLED